MVKKFLATAFTALMFVNIEQAEAQDNSSLAAKGSWTQTCDAGQVTQNDTKCTLDTMCSIGSCNTTSTCPSNGRCLKLSQDYPYDKVCEEWGVQASYSYDVSPTPIILVNCRGELKESTC